MKELWIAEVMDLLQEVVPVMTDEHAHDLADDLHSTCGGEPARLAVTRFFNAIPGWTPVRPLHDSIGLIAAA